MVLDLNPVDDLFERDVGEGDVLTNAGNRRIPRSIKQSTLWLSPDEVSQGTTSDWTTIKSVTFRPLSSQNMFLGLAVQFDGRAAAAAGSWVGRIQITGDNTGNSNTYVDTGSLNGFTIVDDGNYNTANYYMMTPDESDKNQSDAVNLAMNDTSYTVKFQVDSNSTVNTLFIRNVEINIYYIDFEDVASEVIRS